MNFTNQPLEIIMNQLYYLPLRDLLNICQTNYYLQSICQSEYFWAERTRREFGADILQRKPPEISYQQQNLDLSKPIHGWEIADTILENRMDILMAKVTPQQWMVKWAIKGAHLDVLNWLEQFRIQPSQEDIRLIMADGYVDVLRWLARRGILPDPDDLEAAIDHNQLEVLKWLSKEGPEEFPETFGGSEYPEVVFNLQFVNRAASMGNLNILEWYRQHGQHPNQDLVNDLLMEENSLDTLKWLGTSGIYPEATSQSGEYIRDAVIHGEIEELQWLLTKTPDPAAYLDEYTTLYGDENLILLALQDRQYQMAEWLWEHFGEGLMQDAVDQAAIESPETLNWFAEHGFFPS